MKAFLALLIAFSIIVPAQGQILPVKADATTGVLNTPTNLQVGIPYLQGGGTGAITALQQPVNATGGILTFAGLGSVTQAYNANTTLLGNTVSGTSGTLLETNGSAALLTSFPTLNQNTTGSAGSVALSGVTGLGANVQTALGFSLDATGGLASSLAVPGGKMYPVENYGGIADGAVLNDVAMTSGSATLTSTSAHFVAGNVNVSGGVNHGGDIGKLAYYYQGIDVQTTGTATAGSAVLTGIPSTTNLRAGMTVYQPLYKISASGSVTNASTALTVDSTTGLVVGMSIDGPGVHQTTISAINSSTSITMSTAATATSSSLQTNHYIFLLQNIGTVATVLSVDSSSQVTITGGTASKAFTSGPLLFFAQVIATTITAVNSPTSITVANASGVTWSGSGRLLYGTDNTTPIQNAVNAIGAAGRGTIPFKEGTYMMGGPLQNGGDSRRNGVILLPATKPTGSNPGINLIGTSIATPFYTSGTTILCGTPGTGTMPAMFDGGLAASTGGINSNNVFVCKDICFRTVGANPTLGGINNFYGQTMLWENLRYDNDMVDGYPTVYTSFGTSIAFATTNFNIGDQGRATGLDVYGAGIGLLTSQFSSITNSTFAFCGIAGIQLQGANTHFTNVCLLGNKVNIQSYDGNVDTIDGSFSFYNVQGPPALILTTQDFDPMTHGAAMYGRVFVDSLNSVNFIYGDVTPSSAAGKLNIFFSGTGTGSDAPGGTTTNPQNINPPGFTGPIIVNGVGSTINVPGSGNNQTALQMFQSGLLGTENLQALVFGFKPTANNYGLLNFNLTGDGSTANYCYFGMGQGGQFRSMINGDFLASGGNLGPITVGKGLVVPGTSSTNLSTILSAATAARTVTLPDATGTIALSNGGTTATLPSSGMIGEILTSSVASGSSITLTTATPTNIISLSLTAGHWLVFFQANNTSTGATLSAASAGINTTSATLPTDGSEGNSSITMTLGTIKNSIALAPKYVSVTSTTTVYGIESANFTAGSVGGYGVLTAIRQP